MEFNNNLVDEKFLDDVNKIIGVPTKEQMEAYNFVQENMAMAQLMEMLYRYFVDKKEIVIVTVKEMLENLVKDKTPEEVVTTMKYFLKEGDLPSAKIDKIVENFEEDMQKMNADLDKLNEE